MSMLGRIMVWLLALMLVALPVVAVVNGWIGVERWPLRTLRLHGELQRVDAAQVRATLLPHAQRGFFAVRLADAQAAVARLPWVKQVVVEKHWPNVLEVRIVEHHPFALWGQDKVLSEEGRIFPRAGEGPIGNLPQLAGPDIRAREVIALFKDSRSLFANVQLQVKALALDDRGSWSLQLSDGSQVIVGSSEARLRLQRFARLLPKVLASNPHRLQRADLRYTNGFALIWAQPDVARQHSQEQS